MATSKITHTSDVSYTLPNGIDDLILTGTADIDGTGNTLNNQIFGNNANNIIQGLEGNDTLYGLEGRDIVIGGAGDDQVDGGAGDDAVWGEAGDDSLSGGSGNDDIQGGDGFDNLVGGDGSDVLDGGVGGDTMMGGAGDDLYQVDDFSDIVIEQGATVEVAQRVSVDSAGQQANAQSYGSVFSADGTKVLFHSWASNLVASDGNDVADVFVKDLATGEVTRVSTNESGEEANDESYAVAFSADGTKVLFSSKATTLVDNDNNAKQDVFIKDLLTGKVTLVSTNSSSEGFNADSDAVAISVDGTKVLFNSAANNIVAGDTNNSTDAFIKDLETGEIIRVTTDSGDKEARSGGFAVGMSADGTKVLFDSLSADLIANDTNGVRDSFVKNTITDEVIRVTSSKDGTESNGNSEGYAISADGTKVLFDSSADNLVGGDTNRAFDIFVKDLTTGEVTRVSTNKDGIQANSSSIGAAFSADGTKVVFNSLATNLVDNDANDQDDVFVKDLTTGHIVRVSTSLQGAAASGGSDAYAISEDGTKVLFISDAADLVPNDTNDVADVFVSSVNFNLGSDSVYSTVSYTLPTNVENLVLLGNDSLSGTGNDLANIISGTSAGDFLTGLAGNDTLSGLEGNDYLDGGDGDDTLSGNEGDDYLVGGIGNNTYLYTEGHDTINNQEYPSVGEDSGKGDTLLISTLTRQEVVFSQDVQNLSTLIISSINNPTDSIRLNNFFNVSTSLTASNDAVEVIVFKDNTTLTATQIAAIINNAAPTLIQNPISFMVNEDGSITIDLLANATDTDSQTLTLSNVTLLDPSQGKISFLDSQEVVFKPSANFNGAVNLSYTVSDGIESIVGQATIDVKAINDAPKTVSPLVNQMIDEAKAFSYILPVDAFVDVDGDNLSYSATLADDSSSPLPTWLSFNDKTQTFSGTPSFSDSNVLSVKVMASDGTLTATQVFVLEVNNVNQAPIAIVDAPVLITDEDSAVDIDLLARVTDPDNDVVTVQNVSANNGSVVINTDQTVTYTPFANFNGTEQITYTVKDELGATFTRTEQITINAVNDLPVAPSSSVSLANGTEDTAYTIKASDLLQGFSDVDGDTLNVANLITNSGSLKANTDSTFTLTPDANFNGSITLNYKVVDGKGGIIDASSSITFNAVNDAPIIQNPLQLF